MTRKETVNRIMQAVHGVPNDGDLEDSIDEILQKRDAAWRHWMTSKDGYEAALNRPLGKIVSRYRREVQDRKVSAAWRRMEEAEKALGL